MKRQRGLGSWQRTEGRICDQGETGSWMWGTSVSIADTRSSAREKVPGLDPMAQALIQSLVRASGANPLYGEFEVVGVHCDAVDRVVRLGARVSQLRRE